MHLLDATRLAASQRLPKRPAISLSWYAMPLGLAGLGGAWTAAPLGPTAAWFGDAFTALAGMIWLTFTVLYIWSGTRTRGTFRAERTHATRGPLSAYIPVVALLLVIHYERISGQLRSWSVVVLVAALALLAAMILAHWFMGDLDEDAVHAGYYLPVVAGPFIAAVAIHSCGATEAAWAAFGAGAFFLVVLGAVIIGRLMFGSALTGELLPSTAILLAAPATAAIAWTDLRANRPDEIAWCLLGVVVVMLLVQLALIPHYRRLSFGMSWWAFSFPLASAANVTARVLEPHTSAIGLRTGLGFLIIATIVIACLGFATIWLAARHVARRVTRPRAGHRASTGRWVSPHRRTTWPEPIHTPTLW